MLIRLIVPGEYARLEDLNASLETVLQRHGIEPQVRGDVRLIVEELASNAIDHGGDVPPSGHHELSVDIAIAGGLLKLEFRDTGAPFDPTRVPDPRLDADIEQRPLGGLGVYLIRNLAHDIGYRRDGAYNVLSVSLRTPHAEVAE
ncbi:ATP-binding protein [Pseudoxanthomonas mexicana]|uniref:ATP-binding protein n=1 Tax=Pseudoxanthomonas mexicana TaxID=128785 RepID=UPI00398AC998